ncbi:MAG: hypothetical protein GY859_31635 [Desulfobacterales bacterium]|nr:hypothetical protein [Desulfobacterales bacterium]
MFHDILERIDFTIAAHHPEEMLTDTKAGAVVVQCMEQYQVEAQWRPLVCRVVQNTLTAPIRELGEGVVLADLKKKDRLHEVEFFYPFPLPLGTKSQTPDGAASRDGFIRGYVDLIFRHAGKYYIADWKSNKLPEGYAPDVLLDHMTRAGYDLQYKVYTVAALRWLARTLGRRFDPREHFGGVFYFYLRGMGAGPDHGVCHVSPGGIGSLEDVEREIKEMIRVQPGPMGFLPRES